MKTRPRIRHLPYGKRGQSLTETVILAPFFLFFAFGLLQIAQIGVALLVTNYAASSIARKAANETVLNGGNAPVDLSKYQQKAQDLMFAGLQMDSSNNSLKGCVKRDNPQDPTANLNVAVRGKLQAWPFFAEMLNGVWQGQYDAQALTCPDLANRGGFGPFNFSASAPYYFYVTGTAKVRLNYVP